MVGGGEDSESWFWQVWGRAQCWSKWWDTVHSHMPSVYTESQHNRPAFLPKTWSSPAASIMNQPSQPTVHWQLRNNTKLNPDLSIAFLTIISLCWTHEYSITTIHPNVSIPTATVHEVWFFSMCLCETKYFHQSHFAIQFIFHMAPTDMEGSRWFTASKVTY